MAWKYHNLMLRKTFFLFCVFPAFFLCPAAIANIFEQQTSLQEKSHVCNSETEIQRLAANEQLQEMARALVEFKATQFCFILEPAVIVTLLEQNAAYIKFRHQEKEFYTFIKYVLFHH